MGDVLLETGTAYLSLKETSHSLASSAPVTAHGVLRVPHRPPPARPPAAHDNGRVLLLRNVELGQTE